MRKQAAVPCPNQMKIKINTGGRVFILRYTLYLNRKNPVAKNDRVFLYPYSSRRIRKQPKKLFDEINNSHVYVSVCT
jgi:hypothetical protein